MKFKGLNAWLSEINVYNFFGDGQLRYKVWYDRKTDSLFVKPYYYKSKYRREILVGWL